MSFWCWIFGHDEYRRNYSAQEWGYTGNLTRVGKADEYICSRCGNRRLENKRVIERGAK